jgi:hypothetical protein
VDECKPLPDVDKQAATLKEQYEQLTKYQVGAYSRSLFCST